MDFKIGDIVELKKEHLCGSKKWEIIKIGVDFKLKCLECNRVILIERQKALKMIKRKINNQL